ncbi:TRAP transporter small permease [Hyphomonas johnsonii]|uniref:TRAP transporter small permease protein n=1 Tax=Hyphomonas johnsonii MHS-2 TaxID=1280950 RepID=A0A059FRS7_9PROT|nr:TRAP transporter small permease [Hyphomonas johnsonii]KCZ93375.1 tripartite ATP-independent periplasmic transporter DctQ [Hyphomonas johnsonii MHS-2]
MPDTHSPLDRVNKSTLVFGGVGLVLMTLILFWQVFARYVLNSSPAWTEQVAMVLTIWFVFLGAASGVHESFHIRIAEGVDSMSPAWERRVRLLANAITIAFGFSLVVWGSALVMRTWGNAVPALPITRGMVYLVIPVSGLLMSAFAIGHVRQAPPDECEV